MVKAAKDTAAEMDVIDKASQRMKIGAEAYQELAYAAEMSGVEMSVMEKAAKKLEGTDMNMEDAINQIMALGTEEERSAKAAELFGESIAYQMTPLLNVGADGMQQLKDDAHSLGLVMSQEAVSNGATMGDMFANVQKALGSLKNSLMAQFMPYVMDILQWVIDNIPAITETVGKVVSKLKQWIDALLPYVKPIFENLKKVIEGVISLINGDFDGFLKNVLGGIAGLGKSLFNLGKEAFSMLWDGFKTIWNGVKDWVADKVNWLKDKLTFWKKSKSEMDSTDGSHAAGLNYVPYDGYVAELHRGETVLNAGDTQSLISDMAEAIKDAIGGGMGGTIVVQSVLDGKVIGQTAYKYNQQMARAYNR